MEQLKIKEVAEALRTSYQFVYFRVKDGRIKATKLGSKHMVSRAEVDRILNEGVK